MADKTDQSHNPVARRGAIHAFFRGAWEFAKSKAGISVLGPVFGALFGVLGTILVAAADHAYTARTQSLQERVNSTNSLRQLIDSTIAEQALSADALADALERTGAASEVTESWSSYRRARHDYLLQTWRNQLNIEYDNNQGWRSDPVFAIYLNTVISPAFAELDVCLAKARDVYAGTTQAPANADAASAVLKSCKARDEMAALKQCTRDYTLEFDWSVLIERQVLAQDASTVSRIRTGTAHLAAEITGDEKAACAYDADCRQHNFFGNLRNALKQDCGPAPKPTKKGAMLSSFVH